MKTRVQIKNLKELHEEIARRKALKAEQEAYLSEQLKLLEEKVSAPVRTISRITSVFSSLGDPGSKTGRIRGGDWVSNSLRVALPYLFNKVLFKKSGMIKKGLLLLASQQAAGFFNKEQLKSLLSTVTSMIKPSKKQKKEKARKDYGIPPDSEAY